MEILTQSGKRKCMSFGRASLLLFCFLSVALCQQRKTTAKKSSRLHVPKCPRFWRISQLACLVSGRRATNVDPAIALRRCTLSIVHPLLRSRARPRSPRLRLPQRGYPRSL